MASSEDESVVVRLTPEEAMTVIAAVRQYEPYWPSAESAEALVTRLRNVRMEIDSIIAKIRIAARFD
jgi:hypothetical protein